ncbi:MAG: hypothetical protein LBD36_03150 [Holosporales bacterium]|jgi:hypothetical protein|nr:hypothetical protein [Holosporales bacterium]
MHSSQHYSKQVDYDLLEVPGLDNLQIAVIPAMHRSEENEDTGVRTCEWAIQMDFLFIPYIELYGWYAESERENGTDVANGLFTSSSLKHSELVVVLPGGKHLANLENKLASGQFISEVIITRWIKFDLGFITKIPIQINTFKGCFLTAVQQYMDYIIVRMRINKKEVICTAFDQDGFPSGVGMLDMSFVSTDLGWSIF